MVLWWFIGGVVVLLFFHLIKLVLRSTPPCFIDYNMEDFMTPPPYIF